MSWGNRDYWKARRGDLYAEQQQIRRGSGQRSYELQEAWLLALLDSRSAAGLKSRVLDFGVGFGRMAHLLAGRGDVDYHGFDISSEMVEPLLREPPERLRDVGRRVMVADSLAEVRGDRLFDIVFSISVMIHNTPDQAIAALEDMRAALAPGGEIWLVENMPVVFSMLDNVWHDGCWVHDFAFATAAGLDVEIDVHSIPGHSAYRLRLPPADRERQVTWRDANGTVEVIARDAYCARALARTEQAVRGLESEIAGVGPGAGASRDEAELYRRANVMSSALLEQFSGEMADTAGNESAPVSRLIAGFHHLACQLVDARRAAQDYRDRIEAADAAVASLTNRIVAADEAVQAHATRLQAVEEEKRALATRSESAERALSRGEDALRRRQHLMQAIVSPSVEKLEAEMPVVMPAEVRQPDTSLQFDAFRDTRLAQRVAGFELVCHVMHQEWFGIRAAAGALPGRKLAISAVRLPTSKEVDHVADWLARNGVERVVVHGFSESMAALVRGLRAAGVSHVSLVWHGAPVMWMHEPERRLFFLALSLARKGYLHRIQGMRGGTDAVLGRWGWPRQLLNMPPRVDIRPHRVPVRKRGIALAPSWNLLHKNLTTNVLGAIEADCIEQVWVLAEDFALPPDLHAKVKVLPKLEPEKMLDTMRLADVVLNATIVDCHPMVELESLAVRTPAIRGRLWLDALEDHPYVKLTEVHDVLDIRAVADRISAVYRVGRAELEPMMADYERSVVAVSAERYGEFLEL